MPFIEVKIIEGVLPDEKMPELIAALTNAVVQVGGEGFRPMTRCVVQEVRSGWWGSGGKPLTTDIALSGLQASAAQTARGPS